MLPRCTVQWTPDGSTRSTAPVCWPRLPAWPHGGLRVLALARRSHNSLPDTNALDAVESQLELLGLIALIDPPRPEAQAAVCDCISAGITR